jgi:NADP-dependent 3-hydroxy acid dehydrogenase YdfG
MEIGMEFKNIAITGHTSGLGKGLYDHFVSKGCNVTGFSIGNGFDIGKQENIDKIIKLTKDCDLFINNAYSGYAQRDIARLWHQYHRNDTHFIVNISSMAAEPLADIPSVFPWLTPYGEEKYSINKISWEINHSGSKCKSIVVMPGVCQTNFFNPHDTEDNNCRELYERVMETNSIITVDDFVKTVNLALSSINGRNFISSITVLNGY